MRASSVKSAEKKGSTEKIPEVQKSGEVKLSGIKISGTAFRRLTKYGVDQEPYKKVLQVCGEILEDFASKLNG